MAGGFTDATDAYLVTSPDGTTWTERGNPKNKRLGGVTYGEGLFVAVGQADGTDAYIVTSPSYDSTTLVKHNDTDAWTTWQTPVTNGNVGYEPSIAIDGADIYVFYEDDQDDIVYDKYTGSWAGEKILEMHASLQDVKARWAYLNNASYTTYGIDYLYSDGTDVFYNRLEFGGAPGDQDAIGTVTAGTARNISATVDTTNNYVHLIYVNGAGGKAGYVTYDQYDGDWDFANEDLDTSANNQYLSISLNSDNQDLYAVWIKDDSTGDDTDADDVVYKKATYSAGPTWTWGSLNEWKNSTATDTYTNVTANYSGPTHVFVLWTVGDAAPYHIGPWDTIIIPEKLWALLFLGLILPKFWRRRIKRSAPSRPIETDS